MNPPTTSTDDRDARISEAKRFLNLIHSAALWFVIWCGFHGT